MEGSVFGTVSLWLFVYEIPQELLNGFAPNSHGSCVWYGLGWAWRSRSPGTNM